MPYYPEFKALIEKIDSEFTNFNVWVERRKAYDPFGRLQTEAEAKELDAAFYVPGMYHYHCTGDAAGQEMLGNRILTNTATLGVIPWGLFLLGVCRMFCLSCYEIRTKRSHG